MTDPSLLRLMTWLSPAFPVGGFAWSNGLETACLNGSVVDIEHLQEWTSTSLKYGAIHNDLILLAASHKGEVRLPEINELALALTGSAERHKETTELGSAFMTAAQSWTNPTDGSTPKTLAYPVSVGWVAAQNKIALNNTLIAFAHAVVSNQIQAALRLMKVGQQSGVALLATFEPLLLEEASSAENSTLDDIGSCGLNMELAAMNHEDLNSRIFRS